MERWLANERAVRVSALLGALAIAFSSILVRLSHASPSTAAIFRCAFALPVLGCLAWLEDRRLGPRPWADRRIAVGAGVFFAADLIMWHHSIDDVGAGLATVLANIQVVVVPLVAWAVLSERPARRVLAALPIALLGVLMISGALQKGAYGANPPAGPRSDSGQGSRTSASCCCFAAAALTCAGWPGRCSRRPPSRRWSAVIAGLIIGDADLAPGWPGVGWLIVLALTSQVIGWLLITTSLPRLPAAITSLTLTVQPIGSVALAALIFAESPSGLQLAGVAVVIAALMIATWARRPVRRVRPPADYRKRSSDSGRIIPATPGPSSRLTCRSAPCTRITGSPPSLVRARSAAAASSSATAIQVALSSRPRASVRPRQSSSGVSPAQPIATSTCPCRHARPNESVITIAGAALSSS